MPAQLILDTIDGASLELQGTAVKKVRTGVITGVPTTDLADPLLLETALSTIGMPRAADNAPGYGNLPISKIRAVGFCSDGVRVELTYETLSGVTPTAYVITRDSTTRYVRRNTIPGTRLPFLIPHTTTDGTTVDVPDDIGFETVAVNYSIISVSMVQLGSLQQQTATIPTLGQLDGGSGLGVTAQVNALANRTNCVNDATWQGLPKGYWRFTRYLTQESRYQGYYSTVATAESPVIEDWSIVQILQDQRTGRFVDLTDNQMNAMNAAGYSYGKIFASEGIARFGPYPMTSYSGIFTF